MDEARVRSLSLRQFCLAAPHLFLWGGVYFAAYTYGYVVPDQSGLASAVAVPAAVMTDYVIARRTKAASDTAAKTGNFAILFATFLAFITATAAVMQPHDPRQMAAFMSLVVSVAYILLGLGQGRRLIWTGTALGALTLIGYFALPTIFVLRIAVVRGGALVAGGLWLRQA